MIAILKPGKDSTLPKSYRPISLLCHTYKLFERMILNRLNPPIETMIINQQAGFRPGKSTTGQLLNLTQHIEDGYERGVVTGTVFVDISAAYDTISHKLLLNKIYRMTSDIKFTYLIGNMLSNRRYFVDKIQTCVFHLMNRKANRQLNISWCGKKLEHTLSPIYQGVTLDRTLSYSTHITKVKMKTAARNNVLEMGNTSIHHQDNSYSSLLLHG